METIITHVLVAIISVIAGMMLAAILFISGSESGHKWFDDIPDDLKDRGH